MTVLPTMNRALLGLIGHRYGRYRIGVLGNNRLTAPVRFALPLFFSTCIPLVLCVLDDQHRTSDQSHQFSIQRLWRVHHAPAIPRFVGPLQTP